MQFDGVSPVTIIPVGHYNVGISGIEVILNIPGLLLRTTETFNIYWPPFAVLSRL